MSFILPLSFIVCISGTMTILSKRRFEEVLPVSLLFSILIVFITGFFGQLQIGYILVALFALAFPSIIVFRLIKRQGISLSTKNFITPAFFIFIIIYIFVFILNFNRGFTQWDEISHWGPMVKEMFRLDKLYSVAESSLSVHKDYPPAIPLFETMWCKLCGGYKEAFLYRSLQILSLSLFFPCLSKFNWKKSPIFLIKLLFVVIIIVSGILVIRVGEAGFYNTIYIDCFLGLILAYSLSIIIFEQKITKFGIFNLSVALSVLLITKQMGIVFFLLILAVFIANYYIVNRPALKNGTKFHLEKKTALHFVLIALCIGVIPYLFQFCWNQYVTLNDIARQFNTSSIDFTQIIGIAQGTAGETYQHEALVNFVMTILTNSYLDRPIPLTYWQLMLLSVLIFILLGKYGKNYFKKHQTACLNLFLFLGAIGYAAALLLLYVFCFGPYEGPNLASMYRYVNTYWFAVFNLAIMLFLYIEGNREHEGKKVTLLNTGLVIAVMWIVFLDASKVQYLVPAVNYSTVTSICDEDAEIIEDNTAPSDSVFIIAQDTSGYENYMIIYLVLPRTCNRFDYSLGEPYDDNDIYTVDLTVADWQSELANWDYLYLQNVDDAFLMTYGSAFPSGVTVASKQLYKINQQANGTITCDLVN